jgi:hypothetical protein
MVLMAPDEVMKWPEMAGQNAREVTLYRENTRSLLSFLSTIDRRQIRANV